MSCPSMSLIFALYALGPSSEMSIFCYQALAQVLERTADPGGVAILQGMANSIISHLKLSKSALGGNDYNLFKDRPLWPLPPVSTAQKYVDGRLMTKFTEVRD